MQPFVWLGLAAAGAVCVTGISLIVRSARAEMKARRRKETITRWVRAEIVAENGRPRARRTDRLFSS